MVLVASDVMLLRAGGLIFGFCSSALWERSKLLAGDGRPLAPLRGVEGACPTGALLVPMESCSNREGHSGHASGLEELWNFRFDEVSWTQTFDSVVSAQDESDKDLFEVDGAMPLPSPPCFFSPSVLLMPLLEGGRVLLRDCTWLWGQGFFSFLKGSSITAGPPGGFGGPPEDDVQLETRGSGWELRPFLETGRPRPPSMDWILRSCAGSSFWDGDQFISDLVRALGQSLFGELMSYLCNLRRGERPAQVGSLYLFGRRAVFPRMQQPLLGGLTVGILFGFRDPLMQRFQLI